MSRFFTPTGKSIDGVLEWAEMFEDGPTGFPSGHNKMIDTYIGPAWVSTIWLGLDHNFFGEPPLIFETMLFFPKITGWAEMDSYRYHTIEQAVHGHWRLVRRVRRRWPVMLAGATAYKLREGWRRFRS